MEELATAYDIILSYKLDLDDSMGLGAGLEYAGATYAIDNDDLDPNEIGASMMSI
jgi:hypothetical protein